MRINLKVRPRSKKNSVEKIDDFSFLVYTTEPAIANRANMAVIKILAEYFNVSQSRLNIVSGHNSRKKIVEIL